MLGWLKRWWRKRPFEDYFESLARKGKTITKDQLERNAEHVLFTVGNNKYRVKDFLNFLNMSIGETKFFPEDLTDYVMGLKTLAERGLLVKTKQGWKLEINSKINPFMFFNPPKGFSMTFKLSDYVLGVIREKYNLTSEEKAVSALSRAFNASPGKSRIKLDQYNIWGLYINYCNAYHNHISFSRFCEYLANRDINAEMHFTTLGAGMKVSYTMIGNNATTKVLPTASVGKSERKYGRKTYEVKAGLALSPIANKTTPFAQLGYGPTSLVVERHPSLFARIAKAIRLSAVYLKHKIQPLLGFQTGPVIAGIRLGRVWDLIIHGVGKVKDAVFGGLSFAFAAFLEVINMIRHGTEEMEKGITTWDMVKDFFKGFFNPIKIVKDLWNMCVVQPWHTLKNLWFTFRPSKPYRKVDASKLNEKELEKRVKTLKKKYEDEKNDYLASIRALRAFLLKRYGCIDDNTAPEKIGINYDKIIKRLDVLEEKLKKLKKLIEKNNSDKYVRLKNEINKALDAIKGLKEALNRAGFYEFSCFKAVSGWNGKAKLPENLRNSLSNYAVAIEEVELDKSDLDDALDNIIDICSENKELTSFKKTISKIRRDVQSGWSGWWENRGFYHSVLSRFRSWVDHVISAENEIATIDNLLKMKPGEEKKLKLYAYLLRKNVSEAEREGNYHLAMRYLDELYAVHKALKDNKECGRILAERDYIMWKASENSIFTYFSSSAKKEITAHLKSALAAVGVMKSSEKKKRKMSAEEAEAYLKTYFQLAVKIAPYKLVYLASYIPPELEDELLHAINITVNSEEKQHFQPSLARNNENERRVSKNLINSTFSDMLNTLAQEDNNIAYVLKNPDTASSYLSDRTPFQLYIPSLKKTEQVLEWAWNTGKLSKNEKKLILQKLKNTSVYALALAPLSFRRLAEYKDISVYYLAHILLQQGKTKDAEKALERANELIKAYNKAHPEESKKKK